jgi:Vacuolar-sorting-associated 13 protein C-terminal
VFPEKIVIPCFHLIVFAAAGNVKDSNITLKGLAGRNVLLSAPQLVVNLFGHYKSQFIRELYQLVLSAEVLGNILGTVSALSTGVRDLVMEPVSGLSHGPSQFGIGLGELVETSDDLLLHSFTSNLWSAGKGAASLVLNTVKGLGIFASSVSGRLGDGVARMTFDDEYIRGRRMKEARSPAVHVGAEVVDGAKEFARNIGRAVSGKPYTTCAKKW